MPGPCCGGTLPKRNSDEMFDDGPSLPMDVAIKHLEGVLDPQPRS